MFGKFRSAEWCLPVLVLAAVLAWPDCRCAWAVEGARIAGTVSDQTAAVMPGIRVRLEEVATHVVRTAITGADGGYLFLEVPAGQYEIGVEQAGFRPFRQEGLAATAGGALRADITLELGSSAETVRVDADAVHVEVISTQLGEGISAHKVTSVPVNGRSFTDLMAIQPGIVPASSAQPNAVIMTGVTSTPPSGDANPGSLSISGQRETSNGFRVNGSDVEEDVNMGTSILPNLDAIADLRVLTSNFDAEFGNYSGGQVVVTTRSGSDQLHGDVFEFLRNTALDARNYFSTTRAKYDQNQFGATLGGPLMRSKAFFFADYQGTRLTQGVDTGLISVPSAGNRGGDLSSLGEAMKGKVNGQYWANSLAARLGYAVQAGEPYYAQDCGSTSECVFPGGRIPQSAWSAPAQHLIGYIPQANAGTASFSTASATQTLRDDKGAVRVDANTRWGALYGYYFADDYTLDNPYPTGQGGASVPGFNARNQGRAQLFALSDTSVFGSSMVNEFHFSYMRNANNMGQPMGGVGPSLASQGFTQGGPGIVALAPAIEGVANVAFNDFTMGIDTTGLAQWNNIYQWVDNFSRASGAHTFKLGSEFHIDQINTHPDVVDNGSFAFNGSETGVDFADFLLGVASSYTQGEAQDFYNRNRYLGLYGQDSWKLSPNLTVNYGMRWDVIAPWREKYNQLQTLIPGEQSQVFPGAPPGLVFPGDKGVPATLAPTRYGSVSPRVGLAWSPAADDDGGWWRRLLGGAGETSIHAGFGMYYTAYEGLSAGIMSANPPYGFTYTSAAPPLFATPFLAAATGADLGQRFPLQHVPFGASRSHPVNDVDWSKFEPLVGVPAVDHSDRVPYAESYMFSIERQMGGSMVAHASYVGTETHRQLVLEEANPGDPQLCLSLSRASQVASGSATCGPFNESSTFTRANGQVVQGSRTAFGPGFGSVELQKTIGNAHYNALELSLKRSAGPLEFLLGYTYSKSIDQSGGLPEPVNPVNPSLSRGLSAFDLRHSFVASYRYDLPLASWVGGPGKLTGGWALSGITRLTSGFPVTLYNNDDTSLLGTIPNGINNNGVDTPHFAGGALAIHHDGRDGEPAFDTARFSLPALGTQGNVARRFFSGPGAADFDMALLKDLPLAEARNMEFRVESFNVFNHAQFFGAAAVDGNISSQNFGRIETAQSPRLMQLAVKYVF